MKMAVAAALVALAGCRAQTTAAKPELPPLYVLTSLPLLFDEGFAVGPAQGEAAVFLRNHYQLRPIDLPSQLPAGGTLLAAQPRALPAEELVALDAWVHGGGRLVLLADPLLEWPSKRPLGDPLRPASSFADTGLLAHWGLRLDAPEERGPKRLGSGDFIIMFVSAGRLVSEAASCNLSRSEIEAICRIGRGQAVIVADADWLNEQLTSGEPGLFANHMIELNRMIADSETGRP